MLAVLERSPSFPLRVGIVFFSPLSSGKSKLRCLSRLEARQVALTWQEPFLCLLSI